TRVKILKSQAVDGSGVPGEILDIQLTIACTKGAISPARLQKAGKKPCDLAQFLRGNSIAKNTVLT
ncbi:MAG: methionyl-tRNA formyltransferase, partial [Rhizobiaceae bacterium]|nr:methionyl-tRNA formyltransferase [Rhizobiaceae bacterium]